MNAWNGSIKPIVILVVVCLLAGVILSSANLITAPVIAANEERANNETYMAALPEADSFTAVDCDIEGVTAVLQGKKSCCLPEKILGKHQDIPRNI